MKQVQKSLIILLVFAGSTVFAQERPQHEIYSMMVYNFLKYVQWPDQSENGEFVVGVIGNADVFNTLNAWYGGKPRGNKTLIVKKLSSASEAGNCQVVFIDKSRSGEFEAVNNAIKGKGTLVITDKNGLGVKGSSINFKTVDNKLKFELNQRAFEAANLKVSSSLTSMAILI